MIVKLAEKHESCPELTPGAEYPVIGIEADACRVLNDHGAPYLYPPEIFEVVDPREPAGWIVEIGDDGEKYAYPPMLNPADFFEDFFEGKEDAVKAFWRIVNRCMLMTAQAA